MPNHAGPRSPLNQTPLSSPDHRASDPQQLQLRGPHRDQIARALKPIYTAPSESAAMNRFVEFAETWASATVPVKVFAVDDRGGRPIVVHVEGPSRRDVAPGVRHLARPVQ